MAGVCGAVFGVAEAMDGCLPVTIPAAMGQTSINDVAAVLRDGFAELWRDGAWSSTPVSLSRENTTHRSMGTAAWSGDRPVGRTHQGLILLLVFFHLPNVYHTIRPMFEIERAIGARRVIPFLSEEQVRARVSSAASGVVFGFAGERSAD